MDSPSSDERATLLRIARESIVAAVNRRSYEPADVATSADATGAFVTITVEGALHGCTGALETDQPLPWLIARLARSSALADPRFPPLQPHEAERMAVEISLLTAPTPIAPADVRVGVHGLIVERGRARGLLLPQVAVEHRFTAEEFLSATCWKAGLPRDAWREPGTTVLAFMARVFADETAIR